MKAAAYATLVVAALCGAGVPLLAQPWYMTEAAGTWKPWKMQLSSSTRAAAKATAVELKAFEGELVKFTAIWRRAPGVAEPKGFSVETYGHLGGTERRLPGQPPIARMPVAGGVTFAAFPIFEYERKGKRVREDTGETATIGFAVNDLDAGIIGRPGPEEWRSVEHDVIFPFTRTGERAGFPRFEEIVVMTRREAPLWTAVPVLEAWQLQERVTRQGLEEATSQIAKLTAALEAEVDPAEKAKRQADYQQTAKTMPDAVAYLKQMAEVEVIRERTARADLAPTAFEPKRQKQATQDLASVQAIIAALTPEERTAAACYVPGTTRVEGRIKAGPANVRCTALVRPNYDFFDRTLPRSAPQLVILWQAKRCYEDDRERVSDERKGWVAGCVANRKLLETWDRQAILEWLQ
ncbi:hypothetical protein LuPra_01857 [Luteitalea pratensis]|uniref:Uncharacterized protein n=1 Tax=Luteitalea pratensis TaxID=1855912 RepID=A0A143PK75_LUTPR|nr:hypothetical protein [Luteitalea pratensis]AMY08653.1 hypothetical protein LuPra_01857 [Luteitalea pratensis]